MVMVRALREHSNSYLVDNKVHPKKGVGVEYDVPENTADTLLQVGWVEKVEAEEAPSKKAGK